jgi:riboflavin kinase/FMN adenylyltransferase
VNITHDPDTLTLQGCIICIGNFDGVHRGHQMLLEEMQRLARDLKRPSVIITFFPTSKMVFLDTPYLTSFEEKLHLFKPYHPHAVVVIPFDLAYAKTDKSVFLNQLERLTPHTIIVGEDFRFGHARSGSLNDLSHIPEKLEVFGMKRLAGEAIKSSRIRELLTEGRVEQAAELLGYPYFAMGEVTEGQKRGRMIGYPTANVNLPPRKALPLGVFAVWADTPQGRHAGMANVGPRPSFPEAPPSLEVHLFDFDGNLYGQTVSVHFQRYLRGQQSFSGLDELKRQLEQDKQSAKARLAGAR